MDDLYGIIQTFTAEERRAFRQFLQRNPSKRERKDIVLFDLFSADRKPSKAEIQDVLYKGSFDKNAYHSLRKRLNNQINDFVYLSRLDNDHSSAAELNKQMMVAQHLLEHSEARQAWKHLIKAERLAKKTGNNAQLVRIYDLMISNYNNEYSLTEMNELVATRVKTNHLAKEEESLKIVGALVQQEFEKVRLHGEDLDLESLTDRLLQQFELQDSVMRRPRLLYDFVLLTRTIILAKKDFYSFEPFILSAYRRLKALGFFENDLAAHLNFLYLIAHTLYRNKKFEQAIEYLEEMQQYLPKVNKGIFNQFYSKYFLLLAACENFSGNLQVSIAILEDLITSPGINKIDLYNAQLNLGVYYFEAMDYKRAVKIGLLFNHSDKWYEKIMGVEWTLKKSMIETIFQYENGHASLAYDRVESLLKRHKQLLRSPKYRRAGVFLNLLKVVIGDPDVAKSKEFFQRVERSFDWIEKEQEDLQAMAYYAWLKSKMSNEGFYETIMQLMRFDQNDGLRTISS